MGPRSFERGNPRDVGDSAVVFELQWGRAHSSAEIFFHARVKVSRRGIASMGPRSFERGNAPSRSCERADSWHASMGPRSFERGNVGVEAASPNQALTASMGPRSFERG